MHSSHGLGFVSQGFGSTYTRLFLHLIALCSGRDDMKGLLIQIETLRLMSKFQVFLSCLLQGKMCPSSTVQTTPHPQKGPARCPVLRTVWLAPGLSGPPARTAVPPKLQRADRAALAPCWPSRGKVIQLSL